MSPTPTDVASPAAGTGADSVPPAPYGPAGLLLSVVAILLVASVVCTALATVAFGLSVATVGLDPVLAWLQQQSGSAAALQRIAVPAGLVVYATVSLSILAAARFRGGPRWRDLVGWRAWTPLRRGAWPFWTLLAVTLVYSLVADQVVTNLHPAAKDWTPHPDGLPRQLLFLCLAAVAAPLTEELLFRGWIYTSLRAAIGVVAAIVVSAALFALAHWESTHLYAAAIFPVGLALGIVRQRTDSIVASITFHALYNGFASLLLFTQT